MSAARRQKQARICMVCAADFFPARHSSGRYCSRRCAWEARGGAQFNARISRDSAEARADAQRGRGEGRSYRKLNGRHEHRVIAERTLGRALLPGEVVHHIDGNHLNNDPANLAVMTQAAHMREHGLGVPGEPPPWMQRQSAAA